MTRATIQARRIRNPERTDEHDHGTGSICAPGADRAVWAGRLELADELIAPECVDHGLKPGPKWTA